MVDRYSSKNAFSADVWRQIRNKVEKEEGMCSHSNTEGKMTHLRPDLSGLSSMSTVQ